jgi:LmbE family N-acetylglucosaminyl deacetylase
MRVLAVAAHPDDEVLGCGGTLARHAISGDTVAVAILGEGATSRAQRREDAEEADVQVLAEAAGKAAETLSASLLLMGDLPDNRFDTVPLLEVVKLVEGLVDDFGPDIVYTHHSGDLNVDHRVAHQAVVTATRPSGARLVGDVYAFEVPSSTDWAFGACGRAFEPNVFIDITDTMDAKLRAMMCYGSEVRPYPHPRSPEAMEACARRWGSIAGFGAAEAFALVRRLDGGSSR